MRSPEQRCAYQKAYRLKHRVRLAAYLREYKKKNWSRVYAQDRARRAMRLERVREIGRNWARKQPREKLALARRVWRARNRERHLQYQRNWERLAWRNRPEWRLAKCVRNRIRDAIARRSNRAGTLVDLLGCSVAELKAHLEKQFKPGMSWDAAGLWHVDHIRPCSGFDLSNSAEQKECFSYKNLQPLWAVENLKKGAR